jgi:hypothetical protein
MKRFVPFVFLVPLVLSGCITIPAGYVIGLTVAGGAIGAGAAIIQTDVSLRECNQQKACDVPKPFVPLTMEPIPNPPEHHHPKPASPVVSVTPTPTPAPEITGNTTGDVTTTPAYNSEPVADRTWPWRIWGALGVFTALVIGYAVKRRKAKEALPPKRRK